MILERMLKNKMEKKIGNEFSYGTQLNKEDKIVQEKAIDLYRTHFEKAQQLKKEFAVFLDTNVLLGYYQMPLAARKALYAFLEDHQGQIYIPNQVAREHKKHLKKVRQNYSRQLYLNQPSKHQQKVEQQLRDYLEENEDVLEAYPEFKKDLERAYANSSNILNLLNVFSKERTARCKKQLRRYDLENLLPQFNHLEPLQKQEFKFLKAEFDVLKQVIDQVDQKNFEHKVDAYLYQNPNKVFPGIGDLIQKPESPYGDYCIYHEMLKWTAINQPQLPIIFLTNDVTKRDWVDWDKRAYIHYLENFYHNTGNVFYVLHAEAIFSSVLEMPCEHLVTPNEIWEDVEADVLATDTNWLTVTQLQGLLEELYPNRKKVDEPLAFWETLIEDLAEEYSLETYWELKIELLEHYHLLIDLELSRYRIYNQLEALEMTLDLIYE